MNRKEFIKLLPTEKEINAKKKTFLGQSTKTVLHERYYVKGFNDALEYLTSKFPDFTEDEKFAIELYNKDKLQALKYLMHETGRGLKEANDFLKQNQNQ